ncbi:FtsL-like putative cell division protein [Agriterribacter sp.]|uniref:FtsL-like putative cell division protein n=1 Tax=Agriterribacter sp. TaxID=2821509 RepID=UPI002BA15677|nr:FtsL-like putative cell division protein [Agriterribacter sp.]HRP54947.1 FtsL-like putative cell division protein [Agriterribacter sp.]
MPDTENTKHDESPSLTGGVKKWLNYRWMIKNIYFFLFLAILAVVYIYNGHYAENTIKDINRSAKALKELQYEYKTVKGELMMRGKQSELAKAVEPMGLKELKTPPVKIIVKKK